MNELLLYTAQAPVVLETLERDGVSRVKREYIRKKYGDVAWVFFTAYAFFRENARSIVPCPPECESAVWLFRDPRWCYAAPGSLLMRFRIPADQVILFDQRLWNRILSLEYIGRDAADEQRFEQELKSLGLANTQMIFSSAFYPLQKRKILESWKRLFTETDFPDEQAEAAVWELRREWLEDVKQV